MVGPIVREFATPAPTVIGVHQTLEEAHRIMRKQGIRHLPVLGANGALVGILSQRDLYFLETIQGVEPEEVEVEDAMSPEPFVVHPNTQLRAAARRMWQGRLSCSVVVEKQKVVGILTSVDALRALTHLLAPQAARRSGPRRAPARRRAR